MNCSTNLYSWQQKAVDKLIRSKVAGLFFDMGTGKTRTAIEFVRLRQSRISRVLWFCPVSLKETIYHEILKHTDTLPTQIHVFDDKTSERTLPAAFWYIIGLESMGSSNRVTLAANSLIDANTFVIVDESSYIKGHRAIRTQRLTTMCKRAKYRFILTGTPISQGVEDLYAQMRFLSEKILGYRSFYSFARNHLEYSDKFPGMVIRSLRTDWLAAKMHPYTYQVTKAECLDLPPKLYNEYHFGMTLAQWYLYQEAKDEVLRNVPDDYLNSQLAIFRVFTVLQQIVCGFWNRYPPLDYYAYRRRHVKPELIEVSHSRLSRLQTAIDASGSEKLIIWSKYRHCIRQIVDMLSDTYGADNVAQFHGGFNEHERNRELDHFRTAARFLVATQASGGHGLTVNEATTHIFYNNGFKYSERIQAEDRSHRIGQMQPVTYVDIICSNSIDVRIQNAIQRKANLLDDLRRQVDRVKDKSKADIIKEIVKSL